MPQTDFISLPSRETLAVASLSIGINEQWSGHDSLRLTAHRFDLVVLTASDVFSSLTHGGAASLLQLPPPSTAASAAANPGCQVHPL